MTDVFISNLRPKLLVHLDIDIRVQIFLNCAMALKSGIEIGGFADNIQINEVSGEKNLCKLFPTMERSFCCFYTYFGIDVSIVNGLDKRHFKEESSFKHLLPEKPVSNWPEMFYSIG